MVLAVHPPLELPAPLAEAFFLPEVQAADVLYAALARGAARERTQALLGLGVWHVRRGDGREAARRLDEGLSLTRSHRGARDLQRSFWLPLSVAARLQQHYSAADAYATTALRTAGSDQDRAAALLASACSRRLSGDAWQSLTAIHEALHLAPTVDAQVARALTWMSLDPAATAPQAARLAGQVTGTLRSRLAWPLAEQALRAGEQEEAGRWLKIASVDPFACEEAILNPQAAAQAGMPTRTPSMNLAVHVHTLDRQGLQHGERFIPVPGDGRLLALLTFLISGGATHWERAADAVLGSGSRTALYGQVRHHLTTVRRLLGHPEAVTSRRGILMLDPQTQWSCDALDAARRHETTSRPWLPAVTGWWVQDLRTQLLGGPS